MTKCIAGVVRNSSLAAILLASALSACAQPETHLATSDSTTILSDPAAISAVRAAYHERVRLGLGSPFRTIENAVRDARLPNPERAELLRELFERVERGDMYQTGATLPLAHYRVIESAINSADDPRTAELAINLAYEIATSENSVTRELQYAAASTAALMRDRILAQRDAAHVRKVARAHNQAPHTLVPALRATRVLSVEQPLQLQMSDAAQEEASRLAVMLIGGVRHAARTPAVTSEPAVKTSALARDAAISILELPQHHPPQAGLFVAMRAAQLPFNAQNEEKFVAELALHPKQAGLAAQRAAIALRPFAQERVWFEGADTPDAAALFARYGVRVVFDDVPDAWHDYYRFVLDDALADMQRAAPGLFLKGLTIEVGDVASAANHLAYHDPKRRTIRWAPHTGSGSLAHEIGHDLDWQIARRAYKRTGYASDIATDVAAMVLATRADTTPERPTETFARQLDWVVAGSLATQGRMNGHLSSVQHDWLPGHGSARPPLANSKSANALAGMVARGGRLGSEARNTVERAVLATLLPASVRAVREARAQPQATKGPRVARSEAMPGAATSHFVELLSQAASRPLHVVVGSQVCQLWEIGCT